MLDQPAWVAELSAASRQIDCKLRMKEQEIVDSYTAFKFMCNYSDGNFVYSYYTNFCWYNQNFHLGYIKSIKLLKHRWIPKGTHSIKVALSASLSSLALDLLVNLSGVNIYKCAYD